MFLCYKWKTQGRFPDVGDNLLTFFIYNSGVGSSWAHRISALSNVDNILFNMGNSFIFSLMVFTFIIFLSYFLTVSLSFVYLPSACHTSPHINTHISLSSVLRISSLFFSFACHFSRLTVDLPAPSALCQSRFICSHKWASTSHWHWRNR